MAEEVLPIFIALLPCVCMAIEAGAVDVRCPASRGIVSGRDYSELLLCYKGVHEWQQLLS